MRVVPVLLILTLTPVVRPQAAAEDPARQFAFWVGEWDVLNRRLQGGKWVDRERATARIWSAFDGRLVIEHWQSPSMRGFSARAFDPVKKRWVLLLNWPNPSRVSFGTLTGVFRHGRGEFFFDPRRQAGTAPRGRYSFSDISPRRLRWDQAFSSDGGTTWRTDWIMEFTRRSAGAAKLDNGPSKGTSLAPSRRCRALDFVHGTWSAGESTLTAWSILEGAATIGLLVTRSDSVFFVASLETGRRTWTAYVIDDRRRVFERLHGAVEDDEAELAAGTTHLTLARDGDELEWEREVGPRRESLTLTREPDHRPR